MGGSVIAFRVADPRLVANSAFTVNTTKKTKVNDMVTLNFLTLGQAATFTGKSKTTISKALKSGKLSYAEKTVSGQYRIEQSELLRVYPQHEKRTIKNTL